MRFSNTFSILMAAALTEAFALTKRTDCQAQDNECRTGPNANQATCSAQLAACLGYNPYDGNHEASTTDMISHDVESACEATAHICRMLPFANQATCSAELAACLGYNPYAGTPMSGSSHETYDAVPQADTPEGSSWETYDDVPYDDTPEGSSWDTYDAVPQVDSPEGSSWDTYDAIPQGDSPEGSSWETYDDVPYADTPEGSADDIIPAIYGGAAIQNRPYSSFFAVCVAALIVL
ncbi:uncharacterized protein RSE6_12620 [Rhynchosporium secalis]|uniref:Uncharacterized protein n=1 Tax=Rhynchosporium secalis TaxID=38038 RepID=A0A1E1MR00_RHYSE|nr:uncharacterized protein RSE6_12620 [Rhynchosporium secalis]